MKGAAMRMHFMSLGVILLALGNGAVFALTLTSEAFILLDESSYRLEAANGAAADPAAFRVFVHGRSFAFIPTSYVALANLIGLTLVLITLSGGRSDKSNASLSPAP